MSFRYKNALLTLVSLAVIYACYFARVLAGVPYGGEIGLLLGVVVAIVVVQAVIAVTSVDRYGPMDERERGIDRQATAVGYYLLIVSSLISAATIHLGAGRSEMANVILLAIVVSECVRQAVFRSLHHRRA